MSEHESLVEAILDEPKDTVRRLVYADWLEENGSFADGIRARLLRLELREAATKKAAEKKALAVEMQALRNRYQWLMLPALPPGFEGPHLELGIVRILVSSTLPRFVEWGEDYLRGLPPDCRLDLTLSRVPGKGKLNALFDSPAWPRVERLFLRGYASGSEEARRFLGDERLRNLEELFLWGCGVDDGAVQALAATAGHHRLRALYLYGNPFGDIGLEAVAASHSLPRLRDLRADNGRFSATVVRAFEKRRPEVELMLLPDR